MLKHDFKVGDIVRLAPGGCGCAGFCSDHIKARTVFKIIQILGVRKKERRLFG